MNLFRTLAASMLMLSTVGCCCMDPCGSSCQGPCGGGCLVSGMFNNCVCDDDDVYGYGVDMYDSGCSCGQCGRGPRKAHRNRMVSRRGGRMNAFGTAGCCEPTCDTCCGGNGGEWVQGTMMTGGCGGCAGCGGGSPTYAPGTSPTLNTSPTPSPVAPIPPAGSNESDPAHSGAGAFYRNQHGAQPQMVSYEEFQRLPGTVVSGPGMTADSQVSAPSPATMASVPRVTSTPSQMTIRPASLLPPSNVAAPAQQAVWAPAK